MSESTPSSPAARLSQLVAQLPAPEQPAAAPAARDFDALQHAISKSASDEAQSTAPELILLFAWTAPARSALAYFTTKYAELYPRARVVEFTATISEFMPWPATTLAFRERGFEEAFAAIAALGNRASAPRILVHTFSNGGAVRMATFCAAYRRRFGSALPVSAVVLDSCLTRSNIAQKSHTVRDHVFLPGWPYGVRMALWSPFLLVVYATVGYMRFTGEVPDRETTWERWAFRALNDQSLVPTVPRLYIHGTADDVVEIAEGEAHAKDATEAGSQVRFERFEGAVHTGSARSEPDRYWGCVADVWDCAMGEEGSGRPMLRPDLTLHSR